MVEHPELEQYTEKITEIIQLINGDPALTPEEKAQAIKDLNGLPRQRMIEYTALHFGNGEAVTRLLKTEKPTEVKKSTKKSLFTRKKSKD